MSVLSVLACIAACTSNTEESPGEPQDGGKAGTRSLDPSGFDRTCSVDSDCVLVEHVVDCGSCCSSSQAVRSTPMVSAAIAELDCKERDACTMLCTDVVACVNGTCEKKAAPSDGG